MLQANNILSSRRGGGGAAIVIRKPVTLLLLGAIVLVLTFFYTASIVVSSLHSIPDATITITGAADSPVHHVLRRQVEAVDNENNNKLPLKKSNNKGAGNNINVITESTTELRSRLTPSIWTMAGRNSNDAITSIVSEQLLNATEKQRCMELCGKFLYSSIQRAVQVKDMGHDTFVATGDIDSMWTRDSAVQMGIYYGRMTEQPFLRLIVEGAIRRQAFNIIQDPYANAYGRRWKDPKTMALKDRVIGRGGWVDTRNYELDSGAYFMTQLYDYYVTEGLYRPDLALEDPMIFDAVMLMVDTWIVEQDHDSSSPYRYFELPEGGLGSKTAHTGMSWTGFRPSDDPCRYGYLIPANIHAAAGLERILELNKRIWQSEPLGNKASKLLKEMEEGIRLHGVVAVESKSGSGTEKVYAYEVDGNGNVLSDFDDANVPSLLSIPLLGWSGYDHDVYQNTRNRLLDKELNAFYYEGGVLRGIGSPHTPKGFVWPLAMAIEALTESGSEKHVAKTLAFQIRQSLTSACNDAMHEGVSSTGGCPLFSRPWFEWANALFVVLVETALGQRCDLPGQAAILKKNAEEARKKGGKGKGSRPDFYFYQNKYNNKDTSPEFYQGIQALVKYVA